MEYKTQDIPLKDLKLNDSNPRHISEDKLNKLIESIKSFPEMMNLRPVVINEDNVILGGNMRYQAAKKLNLKSIPVVKASDLTPEQQKEFIIKDNVGFGEWDWELLQSDWITEQITEWGLDVPYLDNIDGADVGWNPEKTEDAELGDGINELVGYGLQ